MQIQFPVTDLDNYLSFQEEARGILLGMGDRIQSLKTTDDKNLVEEIFRGFHTIKGVAGFLHLASIQKLSLKLETTFDDIRHRRIMADAGLMDDCLDKLDVLNVMFKHLSEGLDHSAMGENGIFEFHIEDWEEEVQWTPAALQGISGDREMLKEMRAGFIQESGEHLRAFEKAVVELAHDPASLEALRAAFRAIHTFKGNCGLMGLPDMEKIGHRLESVLDEALQARRPVDNGMLECCLACLEAFQEGRRDLAEGGKGCLAMEGLFTETPAGPQIRVGAEDPEARPEATSKGREIRVDPGRLDRLADLVGELESVGRALAGHPELKGMAHEGFDRTARTLAGLTDEIRSAVLGLRKVPIEEVFKKMNRLVQDQCSKTGKQARLEIRGEKTEVDRDIAELLADSLVHMIRNAVDHGLETPLERQEAGKPALGSIILAARQEGASICLFLSDDGQGIARGKILAKAVEKGLLPADHGTLADDEIFRFIFLPGFSTADRITPTSGRGVGMDVVRYNIAKLGGDISITSRQGGGTEMHIRLPSRPV